MIVIKYKLQRKLITVIDLLWYNCIILLCLEHDHLVKKCTFILISKSQTWFALYTQIINCNTTMVVYVTAPNIVTNSVSSLLSSTAVKNAESP